MDEDLEELLDVTISSVESFARLAGKFAEASEQMEEMLRVLRSELKRDREAIVDGIQ